MSDRTGWFADVEDVDHIEGEKPATLDGRLLWQAVLQSPGMCHPLEGIWFTSREDCEDFIREHIIGQGMLP